MQFQSRRLSSRLLITVLILLLSFVFSLALTGSSRWQLWSGAAQASQQSPQHGGDEERPHRRIPFSGKESDWDEEKVWNELVAQHRMNKQRIAAQNPGTESAFAANVNVTDTNDISVIQDDGSLVVPQKFFDLNSRAIQFSPSGNGYTVTAPTIAFDTNLGTKLDLTVSPAVNPKIPATPGVEPGDDAYIFQDLGFNFSYYGTTFTSVAITSNGNLVFRPSGTTDAVFNADRGAVDSGESLSSLQAGLPRIAPYWHDLDARSSVTQGANGIYIRKEASRVLISFNNVRDFPNNPNTDNGIHTFQVSLFSDGRIQFVYNFAAQTSTVLVGIGSGNAASQSPALVDFTNPPATTATTAIAEFFTTTSDFDDIGVVKAFYTAHPNRDVYDFVYIFFDFDVDLGGAFAYHSGIRNEVGGIGRTIRDLDPGGTNSGSVKVQSLLVMNNILTAYPTLPTTHFFGADSSLSIFGQEQGHRWLSFLRHPGADANLLLGRSNNHWNFFLNTESTISSAAARRSSSVEGNVWRENGDGTFTTVNLVGGFSRLDQYAMGLRAANEVPDTFIVANPTNTNRLRGDSPRPNSTANGTKQTITINDIIQATGARVPDVNNSQKDFRAAFVLLTRPGTTPATATLEKMTRFRLAWESYFAQAVDYKATLNTGLADLPAGTSRVIAATSAASYTTVLTPGGIGALFGQGLTSGSTALATTQPLPTTLAGTEVRINGTPAPLFGVSPGQINFQIPRATNATETKFGLTVQSSTATIEVFINGQLVRAGTVLMAPNVPAVFTANASGSGPASALDGVTFTPAPFNAKLTNGQPNVLAIFASGLGADATDTDGNFNTSTTATIDGNPATLDYAGRAPGFTGLNQLNLVLPANITSGNHTLVISRNGVQSNPTTIAIK